MNHGNCDAHSEELNIICKEDSSDLIELDGKRNSPRMSSRSSAFRSTRSVNSKDRQKSCNSRFEDIGVSSTSSFQRGEMCSNQFSKRYALLLFHHIVFFVFFSFLLHFVVSCLKELRLAIFYRKIMDSDCGLWLSFSSVQSWILLWEFFLYFSVYCVGFSFVDNLHQN